MTGLVSWGTGCGEANSPGVYTDISQHREWMTKHLGEPNYLEISAKTAEQSQKQTVSNQTSTEFSLSTDSMEPITLPNTTNSSAEKAVTGIPVHSSKNKTISTTITTTSCTTTSRSEYFTQTDINDFNIANDLNDIMDDIANSQNLSKPVNQTYLFDQASNETSLYVQNDIKNAGAIKHLCVLLLNIIVIMFL